MNSEWDSLSELWASTDEGIRMDAIRRVVRSHRRTLLLVTTGELLVVAIFLAMTFSVLRDGVAAWELVWAATLWMFVIATVVFVWWNRRGTWDTIGATVAEYIRMTRLRAERGLRSLRFAIALFVAELVVIVAQLVWFERLTPRALLLLGASVPILAVWVLFARRRIARDLAVAAQFDRSA